LYFRKESNMKKKLITIITALALIVAVAPIVFANDDTEAQKQNIDDESQAKIAFRAPNIDEGIEADPDGGLNGLNYDFAERTVSFQNESYEAINPAYMRITSTLPWTVSASITPFTKTKTAYPTEKTIEGFTLKLQPETITNHHAGAVGTASVTTQTIRAFDGGGNAVEIGVHGAKSKPIAQGTMGVWNLQIPATLDVLGNTAHVGGATAQINWIFVQTTP